MTIIEVIPKVHPEKLEMFRESKEGYSFLATHLFG